MPRVMGHIVPATADPGAPFVWSWVLPDHVTQAGMIGQPLPAQMQNGMPLAIGMPMLADSIRPLLSPGNSRVYGIVTIDFPDTALVREE